MSKGTNAGKKKIVDARDKHAEDIRDEDRMRRQIKVLNADGTDYAEGFRTNNCGITCEKCGKRDWWMVKHVKAKYKWGNEYVKISDLRCHYKDKWDEIYEIFTNDPKHLYVLYINSKFDKEGVLCGTEEFVVCFTRNCFGCEILRLRANNTWHIEEERAKENKNKKRITAKQKSMIVDAGLILENWPDGIHQTVCCRHKTSGEVLIRMSIVDGDVERAIARVQEYAEIFEIELNPEP